VREVKMGELIRVNFFRKVRLTEKVPAEDRPTSREIGRVKAKMQKVNKIKLESTEEIL
jgi:hypothetical protein